MIRTTLVVALLLNLVAVAGAQRTYTQEVSITFATPEQAAAATLTPTPVLDGKPWALSARWDDNHPGSIPMHDVMAKHGLKGTFYLNAVDPRNRFGQAYVDKLLVGGFSIGGHAQSHPYLNQLNAGEAFYEVLANRVQREAQANQPVVSFAFPYGVWDSKDDPDVGWRSIEVVRRAGFNQIVSTHVYKNNPHIKPGDFAGTLLVMPGDRVIDAKTFNTNLEKFFKWPEPYRQISHCVSLSTHPWQQGKAWEDLDQLLGELKTRTDWWICNHNEYAAYEHQTKKTRIERLSTDGATTTFRLTRPLPAELGAVVPLTVEVAGQVSAVKGDAPHTHRAADGKSFVNFAHAAAQGVPAVVDAIDNLKNDPTPAGESAKLAGVAAWLHAGDDQLSLTLENRSHQPLTDLHITWRLPLAYEQGVQAASAPELKPGEKRVVVCKPGPLSNVEGHKAGGRYHVAEIDFRRDGQMARLFATATVGNVIPPPKGAAPAPASTRPAADMTPFVIPMDVNPASAIAMKGRAIAADGPRVAARDGHFWVGDRRFRAWGVNLNGGACFPTKDRAERMAARLEAFGVNAVRLHHMDNQWTRFPDSIWDPAEPTRMSAEALDRLDYFVDQLARRGICVNLNLHVSRTHSAHLGLPLSKGTGNYDKMVDLFTPQLIAAQKDYARQLLTRVNPHRGVTYAADPAIAFVEINNENSLFMWDYPAKLKAMDGFYAEILRQQFNGWLKQRYGSTEKLAAAWQAGDPEAATAETMPAFKLITTGNAAAEASPIAGGVRIAITAGGAATWNIEHQAAPLPIRSDRYYTLSFRARADGTGRGIVARVGKHGPPYHILGLRQNLKLTGEFKSFSLGFQSPRDEPAAAVSFQAGASGAAVEIADVVLQSRPLTGLQDAETLEAGTVAFNLDGESRPRLHDRLRFMAETEKRYYDSFRQYLKDELGCRSLVTGTMVYGPLGMWAQSDMDYLDAHAYWTHPVFPGNWSDSNWSIEQKAMADSPPLASKLAEVAAARLAGKPFTVSEYNHPAPNDFQAECVPMIAGMAAAQDWDGVWLFAYSSKPADGNGAFDGWFDIEQNPAKWAFMPAGAALFREGGIAPLGPAAVVPLAKGPDPLAELAALQAGSGVMMIDALNNTQSVQESALKTHRLYVSLSGASVPDAADAGTTVDWANGRFTVKGQRGQVRVETPAAGGAFTAIAAAEIDGRTLFTVAGRVENVGMGFSADRRTVGEQWGQPPVQIEKRPATLDYPLRPGQTLHALGPDGVITTVIPQPAADKLTFPGTAGTLWFLLKE